MKLYIGCDPTGINHKKEIILLLNALGHEVIDIPIKEGFEDYPDIAKEVCLNVLKNKYSKGILICGTGMGMCLAANKIKNIRATLCVDVYCADKSRSSNDSNILTLGALTQDVESVKTIVKVWVQDNPLNANSARKLAKIMAFEKENIGSEYNDEQ